MNGDLFLFYFGRATRHQRVVGKIRGGHGKLGAAGRAYEVPGEPP